MKRGQILTLDLILSLIIVFMSIGLMVHYMELNVNSMKDEEMMRELEVIGLSASERLVSAPDIICQMYEKAPPVAIDGYYLPNCIYKKTFSDLTRVQLGIPAGYGCELTTTIAGLNNSKDCAQGNGSASPIDDASNVFAVNRKIVHVDAGGANRVIKDVMEDCIKTGCAGGSVEVGTVTLKVWKSDT